MKEYVVHQRHHFGWTKTKVMAESPNDAMYRDVLSSHDFLTKDNHTHYVSEYGVLIYSAYTRRTLGGLLREGDLWFSVRCRIGENDDCDKCGGTGINYYNPFIQCWECGDGESEGKGTGKVANAEAIG